MLITTLDEAKKYVPSSAIQRFDVIEQFIENAERKEIKPVLGTALYNDLLDSYEGSGEMEDIYLDLLPFVQRALIHFAYYDAIHVLDVIPTQQGFAIVNNSNMAPASANRVEAFKKSMLKAAYGGIESLLQHLEENKSDFSSWTESSFYSEKTGHLLTSARDFDNYVKIDESRLVFLKILPKIEYIEEFEVKPAISEELFDKLIADAKGDSMSLDYTKIYNLLKPSVANMAMAKALDYLSTAIYAEGIMLNYSIGSQSVAGTDRLERLAKDLYRTGMGYLNKARGIILANVDSYTEFKESDLYDSEVTTVKKMYENDEDNHIAFFGGGY